MRNVKLFSLVQNFCLRLIMEKQAQEKEDVRIDTSSQKDQKSFSRSLIKQKVWYILEWSKFWDISHLGLALTYIRYQFFGLVVMMQVTLNPDPRAPYNRIAFYVVLLFINQLLIFLQNWSQVISNYPFIKVPITRVNFFQILITLIHIYVVSTLQ